MMKAYRISTYNKAGKLQLVTVADPIVQENEVLVEIHAASINQLDIKLKYGDFKRILPYRLPLTLGHDVAGVIVQLGSKVSHLKVGDAVFARVADFHIGTFAEYIAVDAKDIALKPAQLSMEEAASIPLVALTVWQALVDIAQLSKGQKVFIQAGSGGVGSIAIQLAKYLGATVATTTSSANAALVTRLGADLVIDYKTTDFESLLKDYDVVLHSQDEDSLHKSIRIVKPGGKVVSISGPPDPAFATRMGLPWIIKMAISFLSRKTRKLAHARHVDYSFLFMHANGTQLTTIAKVMQEGLIVPVVDRIFPFESLNEAMDYVATGRARGKVVLKIR